MKAAPAPDGWYRDREALAFLVRRYLPALLAFSLVWELAQLPLYTLWREASPGYLAFAVLHCTAGDLLFGSAAVALSLSFLRVGSVRPSRSAASGSIPRSAAGPTRRAATGALRDAKLAAALIQIKGLRRERRKLRERALKGESQ